MSATTTVFSLALLGLSSSAFASDLDEVTPFDQVALEEGRSDGPDVQNRRQSHSNTRSNGNRSITRTHATNGKGQTLHRVTATNGDRTVTVTRSNGQQSGSRATRPPPQAAGHAGNPHRPATMVRPDHRPGPAAAHGPVPRHGRFVRYAHVRPYHGVFVYGPRPATHVRYVDAGAGPVRVVRDDLPERSVDREGSVALGVRGGSLLSGSDGYLYGDPGIGGFLRVRPEESVGLELGVSHHGGRFPATETRGQTQVAGSVELFAFPWTRVSPYVLGGVTWNGRSEIDEMVNGATTTTLENRYAQWGLHGGLGLELALGKSAAIDLEARTIGWLNRQPGDAPLALQATGGLLFHF